LDLDPRDEGYGYLKPLDYAREIAAAQAAAPEVRLRQGIELNYQPGLAEQARSWQEGYRWDYVVLSVHLVDYADGWAIVSDPSAMGAYFSGHSQRQAYLPYFEDLLRAAQSGLGDVLGHLDLVKRYGSVHYGPLRPTDFEEEIRAVLRAAIDSGLGLELNTSGLRQSPGEPYPSLPVLRWYREMGGELLTIGSDAHRVEDLGADMDEAPALARQAGFRALATFERRRVSWVDL
jgi:histidinol-phosphatase (PHP family)